MFRTVLESMGLQKKVKPQQARNKWDHLKNKYKVGAGLNDDVETKLYLFYPCKLIHNLLKIADVIDFHRRRIVNIQGQERVSIPEDTPGPSDQEEDFIYILYNSWNKILFYCYTLSIPFTFATFYKITA